MDSSRCETFLYAKIAGNGYSELDSFAAGHPIQRRINRIERVVAAYRGRIQERSGDTLRAMFASADAATLSACEMQHRCAVLPQLSKRLLTLQIGIHRGVLHQRIEDPADNRHEIAEKLALLDNAILVSPDLADGLNADVRKLANPITLDGKLTMPALQIDWRRKIDPTIGGNESYRLSESILSRAESKAAMLMYYGTQTFVISPDNPVITIGRDAQNDLILRDDRVSRNHCRIEQQEGKVILIDSSTNGAYVLMDNGNEFPVKNGSFILRSKGMLFLGRMFNGERRGSIRFELR